MSSEYWKDRQALSLERLTAKNTRETEKQMQKYYTDALSRLFGQFEQTYLKVFSSIDEDKKPTPADLYKLDKYWQLQAQVSKELEKLGDKQARLLSRAFENQYIDIYNSYAIKDATGAFSQLATDKAKQMINVIWCADGKSWSDRIWTNTSKLQQELNDSLIHCLITGKKTTELKKKLQEDFSVSYSRADSLVRTEMAHIQTISAQERYKDAGIEEVEVWADKDERRCEICGNLHEKRFPINGVMPVPAHPRCRCTIIPVVQPNNQLMVIN